MQLLSKDSRIHQDSNTQDGSSLGSVKCYSWASFLAHTFASPCLGREPKARVVTFKPLGFCNIHNFIASFKFHLANKGYIDNIFFWRLRLVTTTIVIFQYKCQIKRCFFKKCHWWQWWGFSQTMQTSGDLENAWMMFNIHLFGRCWCFFSFL